MKENNLPELPHYDTIERTRITRDKFDVLWRKSHLIDDPTIAETEAAFKGWRLALSVIDANTSSKLADRAKREVNLTDGLMHVWSSHDWIEDFAHENGRYECKCSVCGTSFLGHKRRVVCKSCDQQSRNPWAELRNAVPPDVDAAFDAAIGLRKERSLSDEKILELANESEAIHPQGKWKEQMIHFARALLANAPQVPDGWKLVPIEPTGKMLEAPAYGIYHEKVRGIYKAMLSAAPQPEQKEG